MVFFDAPTRSSTRAEGDIYRDKADRLVDATRQLLAGGRYADAEERARELIDLQSKVVGDRHPESANGFCLLAEVLVGKDELADAETLLQHALEVRKKTLGDRHPDYAACLDQLARLMLRWDDLPGAEPLLRKALEIRKAVLGEEHLDYASSLATLGELLERRRAPLEAEPLIREALAVRRKASGGDHEEVAGVMAQLAGVLQKLDRNSEAETLLRGALDIIKAELGESHPAHGKALEALAGLLQNQGDLDGAEPLWRLLLDTRRQGLGRNHVDCATVLTQLGHLCQRRGDVKGAEDLFHQAVDVIREARGERRPEYADALTLHAMSIQRGGDLGAAEPLFRQALAVRKDILGPRHPDYATSLLNLALLVQKRGDPTWARMLLREAVEIRRAVFGDDHPDYAQGLAALADAYAQQGETAKAETLLRQALDVRRRAFGENHPIFAATLASLASLFRTQDEMAEAEVLLRQALEIRKVALGENHLDYATNLGNLAWLLQYRGETDAAEALLSQVVEIRRRLLGESHPEYLSHLERLKNFRHDRRPQGQATPPARTPDPEWTSTEDARSAVPPLETPTNPLPSSAAQLLDETLADNDRRDGLGDRGGFDEFLADKLAPEETKASEPGADGRLVSDEAFGAEGEACGIAEFSQSEAPVSIASTDAETVLDTEIVSVHDQEWSSAPAALKPAEDDPGESLAESTAANLEPEVWSFPGGTGNSAAWVDWSKPDAEVEGAAESSLTADRPIPLSGWSDTEALVLDVEGAAAESPESPVTHPSPASAVDAPIVGVPSVAGAEPARSPLMSQSSSHLSHELAALSDRFSELGERLLSVARQLHAPGLPPGEDLLVSLGDCRRDFGSLRERAVELAGSLHVEVPSDDRLNSLSDLTGLLDHVAEAEIHQSKSEEVRRRAVSVLDRVLMLAHIGDPDFAPLHEVHAKARELHSAVLSASWLEPHSEADRLAEGDHHFADLLTLIQDRDELSDELWATLHENVGQAFGKSLAAAAARSKLTIRPSAEGSHGEMAYSAAHH